MFKLYDRLRRLIGTFKSLSEAIDGAANAWGEVTHSHEDGKPSTAAVAQKGKPVVVSAPNGELLGRIEYEPEAPADDEPTPVETWKKKGRK